MKSAMLAVALMLSSAAIAQTYPAAKPPALPDALAGQSDMTAPSSGQIVAPGNTAPEHDARGIAVISDAALAPPGFNQAPGIPSAMGGPFVEAPLNALATQPATETYPACTATVTDNCVQAYERGRAPQ